jgi:hypothetical protein
MSTVTLVARLDKAGSEQANCYHFVFGRLGSTVSGGFYISKSAPIPTALAVDIPILTEEKEGDKDAKRKGY